MKNRKDKSSETSYKSWSPSGVLDGQRSHWDCKLSDILDMFGNDPSETAQRAIEEFRQAGARNILELGGGQGRDTLFFAENNISVHVIDYSESGISIIRKKAAECGLSGLVSAAIHDVRSPLPFPNESFDGCFAHMLYCMELTISELESLADDVRRVLKPGGIHVYTVRNTTDPHYGKGIHRGEEVYEMNGFIVHFFSMDTVNRIASGYQILDVERCEESSLPRRLFRVTMKKR